MPRQLEWTPRLVARFWDGVAQSVTLDAMSFAKLAGPVLMDFMCPWIAPGARCLDFGGGSGHLLSLMAKAGYRSAIFEPSIQRAAKVTASMTDEPRFLGAISLHDPETFDFVICTEVIEHISRPGTESFMHSMTRRIAPGGLLFLTTPFAEILAENEVYCPSCDHFFHRWQHQRSWELADIEGLMKRWGLATEWLGRVGFDDPHCVRDFHLRRRCGEPWPWLIGKEVPLIGRGDHIVYIGRKPSDGPAVMSTSAHIEPPVLTEAGAKGVVAGGVVASSLDQGKAPIDNPENDVFAEARSEATNVVGGKSGTYGLVESLLLPPIAPQGTLVVLPGSLAPEKSDLQQPPAAYVFEGSWRTALPVDGHIADAGNVLASRGRGGSLIGRTKPRLLQRLRDNLHARQLQPWLDRRESEILRTLLSPSAFPHRLSYAVEGRVLLGISTLGSGGAERQMVNTAQGLRARGVDDVHFLVEYLHDRPENAFYLDKAAKAAASVHTPPNEDYGNAAWATEHPRFKEVLIGGLFGRILNAASIIKKLAPEIVQTSLDWTNITVGIAAVLAGVPRVFISGRNLAPTHFEFFQWFMYPCYRALALHPNVRMLNNSDAGRRDYAEWLNLAPERITILRNGLAADEFPVVDDLSRDATRRELGIAAGSRVVIGAFRLSAEKRPLLWVETAAKIKTRAPDTIFLLCGIGPMEAEVRAAAAAQGLGDSIHYLGVRGEIQTVFSAADLVLHTALQEGTPNALIEAQAMGIPVVTTPAFGAAEAVQHGVTGLVVADETAAGLAGACESILENPRFRAAARDAGPGFIEARFGFDRMVDNTLLVYADAGASWALNCLPERLRHRAYVPLQRATQDSGYAWTVQLPQLEASGDNADHPQRSRLVVLEDGRPLGPAHTTHDIIRNEGGGAFSHWNGSLYFSTSDHTDPTSNGREYVAMIPR